jgi:MutS domain V
MTPSEWYGGRTGHWASALDRDERVATRLSRMRLATFGAGAVLVGWAWHESGYRSADLLFMAGVAAFVVFGVFVRQHARVLERIARAEAGLRLAAIGTARIARDWHALPDLAPPSALDVDTHPYARDIDIFGRASLTKWIGRTATADGQRTLWEWLLNPADREDVLARQPAIDELAGRRDWRETLAIEGELTSLSSAELARFLAWAEDGRSAVPAFMRAAAVALPLATVALLILFLTGAVQGAWWMLPLAINVVLSFAFAARVYATFDRVSIGQRALVRYGRMFDLVCGTTWTSPLLARLDAGMTAGEPAPASVRRIASLAAWSELRTGAAILHFPVQAFTLWDFHVLFAMERWRRRSGARVRTWIEALGELDALAALATVRADEPDWAVPHLDTFADAIVADALGHPLIAAGRRVANDVRIGPPRTMLLVTGSNMSGKSTLLRAAGLNAVLAHAGAPVCAAAMTLPPIELQTSIRVQDSLELGLSYFMAALARLKQIVDAAERGARPGRRLLYLLDEVLQGTNSVERAAAVRAVAQHLLDAGAIGAMTTHDLALAEAEPLKSSAVLVHFTEQVLPDGTMTFDYRLRDGIATSTNALRLMQLIGIRPR